MDKLQQILAIAATVMSLLVGVVSVLIPLVKSEKTKKKLVSFNKIVEKIQPLVIEAEKFTTYSGQEKKQFVITKLNNFALQNKIPFNETDISNKIEEIVSTTKQVNRVVKAEKTKSDLPTIKIV